MADDDTHNLGIGYLLWIFGRARWLQEHEAFDLPNRLRPPCHKNKPNHRYKSMYGRLQWDKPTQTITTGFGSPGQGRYFHPTQLRTLTPHEAARIQFFPDWYDFSAATTRASLAESIGNAVPAKLGFRLALHLLSLVGPT
jgi:DNA (cytosine-5)-methyltransferase 1